MLKDYNFPLCNGKELDNYSKEKFSKIFETIMLWYFHLNTEEVKWISEEKQKIIAHNIAFLLLANI